MNNSEYKILLVDDEPDIIEFLGYNLRKEGYQVYSAGNGKDGVALAKKVLPHLVILDVMMPGQDGIETCRELRDTEELRNVLITFLTARHEDYSQIAGFDAGADDYIYKPIKPRVLLYRIAAMLRRLSLTDIKETENIYVGGLKIDREKYIVIKNGSELYLPKKEFELLSLLASKPKKVFTRNEILDHVWSGQVVVDDRTIDVHVRRLREKVGDSYIKTVKGIGYKFDF
jgi:two-component system alkaline phosphatase synthesis response regulator PhoP